MRGPITPNATSTARTSTPSASAIGSRANQPHPATPQSAIDVSSPSENWAYGMKAATPTPTAPTSPGNTFQTSVRPFTSPAGGGSSAAPVDLEAVRVRPADRPSTPPRSPRSGPGPSDTSSS